MDLRTTLRPPAVIPAKAGTQSFRLLNSGKLWIPASAGMTSNGEPRADRHLDIPSLVGEEAWARLSPAIHHRFAAGHADTTYLGTLDLHCSPLGRLIALATSLLGGPLTTLRQDNVPAEVRVYGNGRGGVVWERRLQVPGRPEARVVRSTKEPAPNGGLVERTDGGLAMELAVFEDDGALVFESRRYFLVLGGVRINVPRWMSPGTCRVEHRDVAPGLFRFTLSMVHPWWGRTFHQTGVFADAKEA